jgi:alanine-synthesizing transaminase
VAAALRFSSRAPWDHSVNRLTRAVEERTARGLPTIDLTETNPTRVGIPYPGEELAEILRRAAGPEYRPHPRGIPEAREALAAALSTAGDPVSPDDLVLTASTSESYSYLFKLFGDPGDEVLTAAPSYPLLDSLAALDGLALRHFALDPRRGFAVETREVERELTPRTRLVALVHPWNPTGRFLSVAELAAVSGLCAARGLPLISDEVFASYAFAADPAAAGPSGSQRAGPAAASAKALSFSLGGLSKSAGLPSLKLGWMRIGGPPHQRRRAAAALELVADSYLSVATPVQRALPEILALAPRIRGAILDRLRANLVALRKAMAGVPAAHLLEPEGGWSAVLRIEHRATDEDLVVDLLARRGVLVQPGYLYDFATEDYIVLSLLPEPEGFAAGARCLADHLGALK